jgi:hypothetical protein
LWDFTERIAKSRREGKNRRDGATVSTRVLALADTAGRQLFASQVAMADGVAEGGGESKERRRRKEVSTVARL